MIILAGISISLVFGERGIITKAKEQKVIQTKAEILDQLELQKTNVLNYDTLHTDLWKYIEHIKEEDLGGHKVTEVIKIDDANAEIVIDGKYIYKVAQIENNVVINVEGYIEELDPQIDSFVVESKTTNTIKVVAKVRRAEKYEFWILKNGNWEKEDVKEETEKIDSNVQKTVTHEYIGLAQGEKYQLKIVAIRGKKQVEKIIDNEKDIGTLEVANLSITVTEPDKWTKGTKTITITPSNNNYSKIRYTLDGTIPTTSSTEYKEPFTVNKNCTIIALAFDNTNQIGASATNTVTKIDKLAPTAFTPEITKKTSRSLTVKATVDDAEATKEDGKSGIAEKGYRFSKDGGKNWTEYQKDNSYTFDGLTQTTKYKIKVEVRDNVGNTTIGTVNEDTQEIPAGNFTFTKSTNNWTNGNVTVTVGTSVTGYTLQTSKDGEKWDNTNTQTLTSNGTVYARLTDGVNTNSVGTVNVSNIDKTAPGATSITYNGGSNSCSWKNNYNLTLSASDSQSGVNHYEIDWTQDGNANRTTESNFVPENGFHTCTARFRAVDAAGNKGTWTESQHIHMDTQAPSKVTMNLNGYSSGSWTNGNVTQTASSSDNVGISYYQYSHDGSSVAGTFPNPWTINWDGQWNFYVRAVDYAGNAGAWSNVYTIRRDTTAPGVPSIGINNIGVNQGSWSYNVLAGNSSDSGSGLARYEYYINNSWTTSSSKSGSGWFSYDIYVRAIDNAGNVSSNSSKIYLNAKRLYIRQLYYGMRNNNNVNESEINYYDQTFGKMAIIAHKIMGSTEAINTNSNLSNYWDRCYIGIFGRNSDSGGKSYMQQKYNSYSGYTDAYKRQLTLLEYINSTEAQNLYNNHMGAVGGGGTTTMEEITSK